MKINLSEIKVTGRNEFIYNGEKWTVEDSKVAEGFSSRWLWTNFTNGKICVRIYKADVANKVSRQAAAALFN